MVQMLNNTEKVEQLARELEIAQILLIAKEYQDSGKTLVELIEYLNGKLNSK